MADNEKKLLVEHPLILQETVDHFVPRAGTWRSTISDEDCPEYIYGIEESAELIQSVCKLVRNAGGQHEMAEEMAHVYITLANMRKLFDIPLSLIQSKVDQKMEKYGLRTSKEITPADINAKIFIVLLWNTEKRADTLICGTVKMLLKDLVDECEANAEHISMSSNEVIWKDNGVSYGITIDISKQVDGSAYAHIMDICTTLHDVWHWKLNVMKGE